MEKTGLKPTDKVAGTTVRQAAKLAEMTDAELVALALNQDQGAYIVLYTRYIKGVRGHIARYISQKEDIEDVCIESFSKAFSQIATYNPDYRFSTWLYRIARNTALDHISRKDREKNNLPTTSISDHDSDAAEIPYPVENPEDRIINRQEYDKWVANIDKLKDDYRKVAKMNLIDNFGYREIAESLDIPINTVKTRIRRAKAQLLKMMQVSDELQ